MPPNKFTINFQQQQRPDMNRLMQLQAATSAAGAAALGGAGQLLPHGLPPGKCRLCLHKMEILMKSRKTIFCKDVWKLFNFYQYSFCFLAFNICY